MYNAFILGTINHEIPIGSSGNIATRAYTLLHESIAHTLSDMVPTKTCKQKYAMSK